ncbi:MAG: hypothetical protein PHS37_04890 [Candidatus Omnitrophica bacterium]|nr:hypothetical protein [Candidatus Omnitrophota bacterium]
MNVEVALEKIKTELRLSSATYTSGYPIGGTSFTAISFPQATVDANGFYTRAGGYISWDRSVIYHLYANPATGKKELRRTEFTDNNAYLTVQTDRESQLTSVVLTGNGSSALNAAHAKTTVIAPRSASERSVEDVAFSITPSVHGFNGYSETEQRTNTSFGIINLTPGYHDLKFKVIGKDSASVGYKFGIDTILIAPSGCNREPEVLKTYSTLLDTIGDSSAKTSNAVGPSPLWSGSFYLEYDADVVNDYLTLRLYYDLWREANFDGAQCVNTYVSSDLHLKLKDLAAGKVQTWSADGQTGVSVADYAGTSLMDKTVRVLVSSANVTSAGNFVRVKFVSNTSQPLTITSVYLDIKDPAGGDTPKLKYDPADAGQLYDYQTNHVQLFFTNTATGAVTAGVTIDPSSPLNPAEPNSVYSNWAIFPLQLSNDYFITFHIIDDTSYDNAAYWPGTGANNSYLIDDESHTTSVTWAGYTASADIYVSGVLEVWNNTGSVTSGIYDTQMSAPVYNQMRWTASTPSGSGIVTKARSSSDQFMTGATDWPSVSGSGTNPRAISIGSGRYLQFRADLTSDASWTCSTHQGVSVTDNDYKHNGIKTCTESGCGMLLQPRASVTSADYCPWIDDVTIDWPGADKICEISGYFRQAPDYGIISLQVDNQDLSKSLSCRISMAEKVYYQVCSTEIAADIEPRNTGK